MFLFFGWGCLIWQPLALQYGKRPVYLLSMLATLATQVWAAHTTTNGQWIASKIVQGFVGAPIESLCEISVTDIYFTHERGRYIALYGLLLAGSNFFAPIIAGFIADGQGWRWVLVRTFLGSYMNDYINHDIVLVRNLQRNWLCFHFPIHGRNKLCPHTHWHYIQYSKHFTTHQDCLR
jgi:MFS family permease